MILVGVVAGSGGGITVTTPSAPTSFTATAVSGGTSVNLSWAAPSNNGGGAITSYTLKRGATTIYTGSGTSFTNTGLTPVTAYSYTVLATNSAGNGPTASASATTSAGVPSAPTITLRSIYTYVYDPGNYDTGPSYAKEFNITLPTPSNNGSALTQALVEISVDGINWSLSLTIAPFPPEQPELGYGNVAYISAASTIYDGGTRYCRVRAVNAVGQSVPSNVLTFTF